MPPIWCKTFGRMPLSLLLQKTNDQKLFFETILKIVQDREQKRVPPIWWKDAFIPSPAKNYQQLCFEKIVQDREQKTFVSTCNFFTISISIEWLYFWLKGCLQYDARHAFIPSPAKNDQQLCLEKIVQDREQKTFVSTCNFLLSKFLLNGFISFFILSIILFFSL